MPKNPFSAIVAYGTTSETSKPSPSRNSGQSPENEPKSLRKAYMEMSLPSMDIALSVMTVLRSIV